MAYSFRINIITPEEIYFSGEIISLNAPGAKGYFGVLLNHAPFVTPLMRGRVMLQMADHSHQAFFVEGGFFEVAYNQAMLLVEKITTIDSPPKSS